MTNLHALRGATIGRRTTVLTAAAAMLMACSHRGLFAQSAAQAKPAAAARRATSGWRSLSLADFRAYRDNAAPKGWTVVGNTMTKSRGADDLISKDQFANFELQFDWKIGKEGNSGVFYRGTHEYDEIYWSAPEYQLLDDDDTPDGKSPLTSAGSDYAVYPATRGAAKKFGEWNASRIVVDGAHVEHWLNGQKVVTYELWSPDWKAHVAASKFKAFPNYGLAKRGYIGIQGDHPGTVELRGIRIRELP